jgi:hypothetical protein
MISEQREAAFIDFDAVINYEAFPLEIYAKPYPKGPFLE